MEHTTNEEDLREAARLQARLRDSSGPAEGSGDGFSHTGPGVDSASTAPLVPNVSIADGAHKYVLISAVRDNDRQHFVVSRRGAAYHRDAAEPTVEALERSGYTSINILGGGRIRLDVDNSTIAVYGYSYGFGLADHALTKAILERDPRYATFDITWSNDGY
jgi:phosphohistidine phosphatase